MDPQRSDRRRVISSRRPSSEVLAAFDEAFNQAAEGAAPYLITAGVRPKGFGLFGKGRLSKALAAVEQALGIYDGDVRAWELAGRIHQRLDDPRACLRHLAKAVELSDDATKIQEWAQIAAELGQARAALAWSRRSIELAPDDRHLRTEHAALCIFSGQLAEASALLSEVVKQHPDDERALGYAKTVSVLIGGSVGGPGSREALDRMARAISQSG
jgi:tetratricopeptide (TPR) repeat protein